MTAHDNVTRLTQWQDGECDQVLDIPEADPWPVLPDHAFHGPVGRYVQRLEPHTEADPVAILIQMLTMAGNLIGRGPHFKVEADEHHLNLFVALVGQSSKGRKGVSSGQAKRLLHPIDPDWFEDRIEQGLSSGEGLIWNVRDPIEKLEAVKENGKPTGEMQGVMTDPGVADKRLLIVEGEFATVLRVLKREGNTLSPILRNAWDGGRLSSLTKNSPARATNPHISVIGHITQEELLRYLDSTETANGFGNRFLWCCVRRSKFLPDGGQSHLIDFQAEIEELSERVIFARQVGEIRRDEEARGLWHDVYRRLSEGKPGLFGSMVGRAEAQTMRLACLYAVLDGSELVRAEHLMAALALWTYCEQSARRIFGSSLGDPIADELLRALRSAPGGMSKSAISNHFSRHRKGKKLQTALALLRDQGLIASEKEPTKGRPIEIWKAVEDGREKSERSEISR